ncbi:MAG: hypothetical protein J1E34_03755 [Oscillospiraceae bacterium]|nr:hypothetical protein [Oscillospiraceae bacterium]
MKRIIAGILVLCLVSVFSMSSCKKDAPNINEAPGVQIPEDYDEVSFQNYFDDTLSEMSALENAENSSFVRVVSSADALMSTLSGGKDEFIKLSGCAGESIIVPSADYKDVTLIVDIPEAELALRASFKAVSVYSVGENGIDFSGSSDNFAVFGENVTANISGTVNNVFIEGKNCVLTVSGKCGNIVNVNTTTEIINNTENDITVFSSTGAKIVIPAGSTLSSN